MAQAGFWDDGKQAQTLLSEMKKLKATIDPVLTLTDQLDDIKALGELTQEEEDEHSLDEHDREISSFASTLERVETKAIGLRC